MNAVFSTLRGEGLLLEDNKVVARISPTAVHALNECDEPDILADSWMREVEGAVITEDVSTDVVLQRFSNAHAQEQLFTLFLPLFDDALKADCRISVVREMEAFLAEHPESILKAQNRFHSARFNELGRLDLAIHTAADAECSRIAAFLRILRRRQELISEVEVAWSSIPASAFPPAGYAEYARSVLVDDGVFLRLVETIERRLDLTMHLEHEEKHLSSYDLQKLGNWFKQWAFNLSATIQQKGRLTTLAPPLARRPDIQQTRKPALPLRTHHRRADAELHPQGAEGTFSPATTKLHPHATVELFTITPTVWDRVCELLVKRLGGDNFQRCFSGSTARLADDGRFVITVPNPIHQLWIESNHTAAVAAAVAEITGVPAIIEFQVATEPLSAATSFAPLPELKAARINAADTAPIRFFSEAGLNAKFNFDSYVIGTNSSYSVAAARAVAEKPGRIYNPLFFYGPTGLGKTHLMQAIGQEVLARKPRANVRYVTSEQFTNEFVDAIKKQTFSQFRQKFRKLDVLLIDDVHFFEGKDSTQEEFFHTFNELFNNAKQIVLASDRPPSEIKNLESRLVSRFEWGLATQIQVPDFETRIAILRRKQSDFNVSLDSWILDFMAQHIRANVRKLEGALMRVAAHISLEGAVATESALATLLHDVIDEDKSKTVTVDRIQRIIATHYDLRVSDLTGPRRPKNIVEARNVAMYLTRTLTKLPLVQIGDEFGGRDHGTVIHACKVVTNNLNASNDFKRTLDSLAGKIREEETQGETP